MNIGATGATQKFDARRMVAKEKLTEELTLLRDHKGIMCVCPGCGTRYYISKKLHSTSTACLLEYELKHGQCPCCNALESGDSLLIEVLEARKVTTYKFKVGGKVVQALRLPERYRVGRE